MTNVVTMSFLDRKLRARGHLTGIVLGAALFCACSSEAAHDSDTKTAKAIAQRTHALTNANPVQQCGFPTTVSLPGCTGTLVHERVISTAQHCNPEGRSIAFGEESGQFHRIPIRRCIGQGSEDATLCELDEAAPLPVTPVLFGCEVDTYMQPGQEVLFSGYGLVGADAPPDGKRWAPQVIDSVEPQRTIIGKPGDDVSACPGDSGGPVFVRVSDGSLRVFGTVLGGTTNIPCNSAVDMQRIDRVIPHFERETGIDITPCFDGQTGAWDPAPNCGAFNMTLQSGAGNWQTWCEDNAVSGMSAECGEPYASESGPTAEGAPPAAASPNGLPAEGCAFTAAGPHPPHQAAWQLSGLLALALWRRRKKRTHILVP